MFRLLLFNTAAAAADSLRTQIAPLASPVAFASPIYYLSSEAFFLYFNPYQKCPQNSTLIPIKSESSKGP